MVLGHAKTRERVRVLGCAITLMALEAIAWKFAAERDHQAVARHLGDDRRGSNGKRARIALHDRTGGAGEARCAIAIDQHELRL